MSAHEAPAVAEPPPDYGAFHRPMPPPEPRRLVPTRPRPKAPQPEPSPRQQPARTSEDKLASPSQSGQATREASGNALMTEQKLRKEMLEAENRQTERVSKIKERLRLVEEVSAQPKPSTALAQPASNLSKQVHVLGLDPTGNYMTHSLSSCEWLPPPRMLVSDALLADTWVNCGRRIHVRRDGRTIPTRRVIGEFVGHQGPARQVTEYIENLVITLPPVDTVKAMEPIAHRLDGSSTICLVQDGLGVMEAINNTYFRNPAKRPHYILGHLSHNLYYDKTPFTVTEQAAGRLYLSAVWREAQENSLIRIHPPVEQHEREQSLMGLLSAVPHLQTLNSRYDAFLAKRLPSMIFRSVVDPLTAVMDCKIGEVYKSRYAMQLFDQLLDEIARVVLRLPELRDATEFRNWVRRGPLRKSILNKMRPRADHGSKMRQQVHKGWETDIDFLNGYFVRRGREVGVRCPVNESVIWMVKARWERENNMRWKSEVPFLQDGDEFSEVAMGEDEEVEVSE